MAVLVNGAGNEVTSQMDADLFTMIFGTKRMVFNIGRKMQAEIVDNNTVRIYDGELISKGRLVYIIPNTYDVFKIETGVQGVIRYDIIGYRLYRNSGKELCEGFVKKDVGIAGVIEEKNFRDGVEEVYIPLYRIKIDSLTITEISALYDGIFSGLQREIGYGSAEPESDTGQDGDIYIVLEE